MPHQIGLTGHGGEAHSTTVDLLPDSCPICHRAIDPRKFPGAAIDPHLSRIQVIFQCPHPDCRNFFIGTYARINSRTGISHTHDLIRVAPQVPPKQEFPAEVAGLSPTFVEIYNQAARAEAGGLDQIAGMALRKAVEFLVKDFAIHRNPAEGEEIKKTPLAACITRFIDDPNVKLSATRATWLGNDETHYVRRWEDRDITDLKVLIRLTVNWIENVLLTEKYASEMR